MPVPQILPALAQGQKLICVLGLLNRSIVNATISKAAAQKIGLTEATNFKERIKLLKGLKIGVHPRRRADLARRP